MLAILGIGIYFVFMQNLLLWLSQFLYLTPLSATLLRIVLGAYIGYFAFHLYETREGIARRHWPLLGHIRPWLLWIGVVVLGVVAAMLIIGYLTQIAAIIAAIAMAKLWYFNPKLEGLGFYSRNTTFLLFIICISLFVTGAGIYAVDLPLY